jgi:hypothetical protein
MLTQLHDTLRALLHAGGIPPAEVDVRFEAPVRQWVDSRTQPTVNLFLFDIRENTDLRPAAAQTTRSNGQAERRMPPRRIDLRYMASVLSTEIEDEHLLLWRVLATLMRHPELPPELLPEELRGLDAPFRARVGPAEETPGWTEIWSALGTPPRPALLYTVTAPLDLEFAAQAPLVLTRTTRYVRAAGESSAEEGILIGGSVRDGAGAPIPGVTVTLLGSAGEGSRTDGEGRFRLTGAPAGPVTLLVSRAGEAPRKVRVKAPADAYDITLD